MSSSKTKRTITVEKSSSDSNVKSKPSVFERLGAPHSVGSERQEICLDFAKNGVCNYGSKCKYSHVTPRRDRDRDRDDLRNRVSRKRDGNESDPEAKKSVSQRKDKDSKIKSAVVVTKSTESIEDIWPESSGDVDKGSVDRKHESKSRQQGSSSSHGTETDGHKTSKQDVRLDDRKDEGAALQSSSSKIKNKSPSHGVDDSSRRKSKDKKKKKRNRSQGSRSPDRTDDKQEQKHQKDSLLSSKSSSDKHKLASETRKVESSASVAGQTSDRSSEKKPKPKDEKKIENRLLMLAMESETKLDTVRVGRTRSPVKSKRELSPPLPPPPPPPSHGKGKDTRKDYTSPSLRTKDARKERIESPSKSKKLVKERSISPTRSKDVRRDRSVSPSRSKDRVAKTSHSKSQILPPTGSGRAGDKLKPTAEEKPLDQPAKRDGGSLKVEKVKATRKRRRSSTSSASSSSSSSSGSDTGSSSGSSSSGSSSSSSCSSDESSDNRKPTKERRVKDAKLTVGRQADAKAIRPDDEKGSAKVGNRSKKDKDRTPLDEPRALRLGDEKDKTRTLESAKHGHAKKDLSPGRGRKKDWEKGGPRHPQDSGLDSHSAKASADLDKTSRDSQDRSGTGDSSRQKPVDVVEYSRKTRSPTSKDDRVKPATPADISRRGQSPAESLRSHHSTKPVPDQERDLEGQSSSGQYRDYYPGREKSGRKDDDRYQQYEEPFAKKLPDARSQGYSTHKHQSADPYDRSREPADLDRDERDSRYSRDHGYEADRYAVSTERHHTEVGDESRSRQDYYSSSYRDDRRSGRADEFARKEPDRVDKHTSSYETRESERDYDAREREKSRDQRPGDYREKPRGEAIVHSSSKYKKDDPVVQDAPLDDSRRDRISRRGQWESEREADDQARQITGRSDQSRGYADKREISRKRPLEEEGGSVRSPITKKMREGSPSESHQSFNSRTAFDRDTDRLDKERSQRGRNVGRDDDRHSNRGEGEFRDKGRSDRERVTEKDWESSRRQDSKDRSKDPKAIIDGRERAPDIKESWHSRDDSHKRRRSLEKTGAERDGWERGKDWKRSRIDPEVDQKALQLAERDKPLMERASRRDEDHRLSPGRDRSPKSSSYAYKQERTDGDKRSSDTLAFVKSIEAEVETRGARVKSEEKRDLVVKDVEPSMIPVHVDDRMRRSLSRGSLSSKHSQRDRETRRDDRHYEDRFDLYSRDAHYRDERLPVPERTYDHEDREPWARDRSYDRVRPEDEAGRPFRGPAFDHDRGERDLSKSREFSETDWGEVDPFRRDNLGFRGMPRPPNWERDRPRDDWDNRYDRGLEPDYRARREVLLPPPPRPRPVPEVRVPSPLPPPVEPVVVVPPPVEHIPVRAPEVKPEHVTPTKGGRGPKDKDEDTGYDDISDGELDDLIGVIVEDKEEHQVKKTGVVDILDIKWESLMQNSHEKQAISGSILSRFQAAAIFRRIGVSRSFAGDNLLDQVKAVCQKQFEEEESVETKEERKEPEERPVDVKMEEPEKVVVKEEPEEAATIKSSSPIKNSLEVQPPPIKVAPIKFELLDDIADFHAGLQAKSTERIGIVTSVGPYRRALCARRDLAIRRGLCKVEKEDILMFPTHVVDQDLYKQSLQLFHHDRTVEKKIPLGTCASQRLHPVSAA